MNWFSRLFRGERAPVAPAVIPSPISFSGRPTYVTSSYGGIAQVIPRDTAHSILGALYRGIPAMKETFSIYSGFVGTPELVCENERDTEELRAWRDSVSIGAPGLGCSGLTSLIGDHLAQAGLYGFGVGECGIGVKRDGVVRIVSYATPAFHFETDAGGGVRVVQGGGFGADKVYLNPETSFVSTLDPLGSDPNGQPLFYSIPMVGQVMIEAWASLRANWWRAGDVRYHVNWRPPATLHDPYGVTAAGVRSNLETSWNSAMKSAVEKGQVLDFYSTGEVTVSVIGADGGPIMDIEVSKRQLMEEIVVASGIPAFMFSYQWATTERMSDVQAQKFSERIRSFRRMLESSIRKIVDLHMRLRGRVVPYDVDWPDTLLNDLLATSQADLNDARAEKQRIDNAIAKWRIGLVSQLQVAEELMGVAVVDRPMEEPPSAPIPTAAEEADPAAGNGPPDGDAPPDALQRALWGDLWADYGEKVGCGNGNGRH